MSRTTILIPFASLLILCGYAAELPAITAKVESYEDPSALLQGCSLGCAVDWELKTSSSDESNEADAHNATKLNDGDANTAWICGSTNFGVGESVAFIFSKDLWANARPENVESDRLPLNGFTILNGYAQSEKVWKENARVKTLRLYHNDVALLDIRLNDSIKVQTVEIESVWIKPGDEIKLVITNVYPGDRSKRIAISELIPNAAH